MNIWYTVPQYSQFSLVLYKPCTRDYSHWIKHTNFKESLLYRACLCCLTYSLSILKYCESYHVFVTLITRTKLNHAPQHEFLAVNIFLRKLDILNSGPACVIMPLFKSQEVSLICLTSAFSSPQTKRQMKVDKWVFFWHCLTFFFS